MNKMREELVEEFLKSLHEEQLPSFPSACHCSYEIMYYPPRTKRQKKKHKKMLLPLKAGK